MKHVDIQEEVAQIRDRLAEEDQIAARYGSGSGPWAIFRGAIHMLMQKGMRNRVILVFCSFALQNMSGAAGTFVSAHDKFPPETPY